MWYEDLTECDYFGEEIARNLTSVSWLENGKDFRKGTVSKECFSKLCEIQKSPWTLPGMFLGFHECDLCQFEGMTGKSNIFIPHNGKIYVCPELITHYINNHFYLPPDEFIEAVLNCPPQRSMEFLKKMLENGGRELVKLGKK